MGRKRKKNKEITQAMLNHLWKLSERPPTKPPNPCWVIIDFNGMLVYFDETLLIFSSEEKAKKFLDKLSRGDKNWKKSTIKPLPWSEIAISNRNYDGAMLDWIGFGEGVSDGGGHIQFPPQSSMN